MDFANILYQIMKEEGLNQSEISRRTGFTTSFISALVHKKRYPSWRTVKHILDSLGYEIAVQKKEKRGTENDI